MRPATLLLFGLLLANLPALSGCGKSKDKDAGDKKEADAPKAKGKDPGEFKEKEPGKDPGAFKETPPVDGKDGAATSLQAEDLAEKLRTSTEEVNKAHEGKVVEIQGLVTGLDLAQGEIKLRGLKMPPDNVEVRISPKSEEMVRALKEVAAGQTVSGKGIYSYRLSGEKSFATIEKATFKVIKGEGPRTALSQALSQEFAKDAAAAGKIYLGKDLLIRGKLVALTKDAVPRLSLEGDKEVKVIVELGTPILPPDLKIDQEVTVRGLCENYRDTEKEVHIINALILAVK